MPKKILLVEDDKFLGELMARKLAQAKYLVSRAVDANEAFEKIKERPDLILLDLLLPGMNGYELLETLKKDKDLAAIPVIILSNLGQREEIEKGLKLGAVDYMVKADFTTTEIIKKIQEYI